MHNILVTGANGYIGRHIVKQLTLQNPQDKIIAVDLSFNEFLKNVEYITYDILQNYECENVYEICGKPDKIIHLAWQDGFNHNAESHLNNFAAHFMFLKNMIDQGTRQIAVAGSFREYGKCYGKINEDAATCADNFYALAKITLKKALEIYIADKNICLQWMRFFTPYGDDWANNSILSKILLWEKEGKTSFPFTDGTEQYDYIHVEKLSQQVAAVINQTKYRGVINICSGKPVFLKEVVENFLQRNNLKIRPEYGAFPSREYDSPLIYGNDSTIRKIMGED